jgi:capsular polysaccharide biosynthesis protein
MENIYGKLRPEDVLTLKLVIELFRKHNLRAGLHGTSLWNAQYKDVDLLVVALSENSGAKSFLEALADLKKEYSAKILQQKGEENIGLDYDIEIGKIILHLSYVVLL